MTTATKPELQELYRRIAEQFARLVRRALGPRAHSVILYGSVARGEAIKDSDIDVLVLAEDDTGTWERIQEIASQLFEKNEYRGSISPLLMPITNLTRLGRGGFPIAGHIMEEGIVLLDDGTFAEWKEAGVASTKPGDEYIRLKLRQAEEVLNDARLLIGAERLGSAVDRAFYIMLHSAEAALGLYGVEPGRTHSGVHWRISHHLVGGGILEKRLADGYEKARVLRITATYTGGSISRQVAEDTIQLGEEFLDRVRTLARERGSL